MWYNKLIQLWNFAFSSSSFDYCFICTWCGMKCSNETWIFCFMMMIAPNSRAHKGGKVKGKYGGTWGKEEGNANYGRMVQPSQQHAAPCVKGVEVGTRGLKMVAAFWAGIPVEVTHETHDVDSLPSGHAFSRLIRHAGKCWVYYSTPATPARWISWCIISSVPTISAWISSLNEHAIWIERSPTQPCKERWAAVGELYILHESRPFSSSFFDTQTYCKNMRIKISII